MCSNCTHKLEITKTSKMRTTCSMMALSVTLAFVILSAMTVSATKLDTILRKKLSQPWFFKKHFPKRRFATIQPEVVEQFICHLSDEQKEFLVRDNFKPCKHCQESTASRGVGGLENAVPAHKLDVCFTLQELEDSRAVPTTQCTCVYPPASATLLGEGGWLDVEMGIGAGDLTDGARNGWEYLIYLINRLMHCSCAKGKLMTMVAEDDLTKDEHDIALRCLTQEEKSCDKCEEGIVQSGYIPTHYGCGYHFMKRQECQKCGVAAQHPLDKCKHDWVGGDIKRQTFSRYCYTCKTTDPANEHESDGKCQRVFSGDANPHATNKECDAADCEWHSKCINVAQDGTGECGGPWVNRHNCDVCETYFFRETKTLINHGDAFYTCISCDDTNIGNYDICEDCWNARHDGVEYILRRGI